MRTRLMPWSPGFALHASLLVLFWTSGFIGIRFLADIASVPAILFWRSFVSGAILLPLALRQPWPDRRALAAQAGLGALGMYLYLSGFALAIGLGLPTGLVALIADMLPLGVALLSGPVLGLVLTGRQWRGAALGVAGVTLVSAQNLRLGGEAPLIAYALPVAGTLAFALSSVLQQRLGTRGLPVTQSLCLQCLTAAALFALTALPFGGILAPASPAFALGIGWLVCFATFGGYGTSYLCLTLYPAARVSAVLYLSPPVTLVWAHLAFAEPLTPAMLAGTAVTLAGVWLATAPSPRPARNPQGVS